MILHKIYASAREKAGKVRGIDLYEKMKEKRDNVYYFEEIDDAAPFLEKTLKKGDLFVTLGAGQNWKLSHTLFRKAQSVDKGNGQ